MKKRDIREIVVTAVSLFLICAVSAGILAAVNEKTAPMIRTLAQETAEAARTEVLPDAVSFEEVPLPDGGTGYRGLDASGAPCGYVFTTAASSYGGKLEVMTGIGADGAVTGIKILSIEDTPGLGMNAKRPAFSDQYLGKSGSLTVVKGDAAGENEIAAITSATVTSKAVTAAVNDALAYFARLGGEAAS